jgi:hypothetical protein
VNEAFGSLRSALASGPSARAWGEVVRVLDGASGHVARERLIPYARRALDAWPDDVLVAPAHWLGALARGRRPAGLALARSIVVDDRLGPGTWLRTLAKAQGLDAVRSLSVVGRAAQARDLDALSTARSLGALTRVRLVRAGARADHVTPLLDPRALGARLTSLEVVDGALGADRWWLERARSSHLPALRALTLRRCGLSAEHFDALARAPWFPLLSSLSLRGCDVGDEAMRAWSRMRDPAPAPAWLDLSSQAIVLRRAETYLSDRGVIDLCANPAARGLVRLDLSDNPRLQDKAAAALASSPHLGALRHLDLSGANLSPAGYDAIAASEALRLDTLTVSADLHPIARDVLARGPFEVISRG